MWNTARKVLTSRQKNKPETNKIMLNHVVLFKLKEYPEAEKREVLARLKTALEGLSDKIEELKYIEVGLNYELNAKSYDICLITHFISVEDFEVYRVHPEHLKVVELIGQTTVSRAAVDFEF